MGAEDQDLRGGQGRRRRWWTWQVPLQVQIKPKEVSQVAHSLQVPLQVSRQIQEVWRQGPFQVEVQVWSQEVKKPQPFIRTTSHLLRSRISGINASLDYLLLKTIDSVTSMFLFFELYNLK